MIVVAVLLSACDPPTTSTPPDGPVRYLDAPIAAHRVNGVAYATLLAGDIVYLGGTFTTVSNQAGQFVASRANVAAFNKYTGELLSTFRADTNAIVRKLAYDGTNLYLGGDFTRVNGASRGRLAAVDPLTGEVRGNWVANSSSIVYGLAVGGGRLFVSGTFSSIGGVARNRVAAVSLANGAVDPSFDPDVSGTVATIAATTDGSKVFIGGSYTAVGGTSAHLLTALDGTTGAITTPTFTGVSGQALDLMMEPNGEHLAASLGDYGNQTAWFDLRTGAKVVSQRCGGDGQAVAIAGETLLGGFHEECQGDYSIRLIANNVLTGQRDMTWLPSFDRFWGVRDLAVDADTLAVAGDFTNVAGVRAQGIAIFRMAPPPPPPPVRLLQGSTWRYLDTGTLEPGWTDPTFDDSAWATGQAQLGYGDGDEHTTVSWGPDSNHKYPTTWFRTTFEATAIPSTLTLDLLADDGAIVYVNGVEVLRDNVGGGADTATLLAASNRSGSAENAVRSFPLPPGLVHVGTNSIAVSVHQDYVGSSDLGFEAGLRSTP